MSYIHYAVEQAMRLDVYKYFPGFSGAR